MAICPIICSFYYLADMAGEIACAEGCAETISANVLKGTCTTENKMDSIISLCSEKGAHATSPDSRDPQKLHVSLKIEMRAFFIVTFITFLSVPETIL